MRVSLVAADDEDARSGAQAVHANRPHGDDVVGVPADVRVHNQSPCASLGLLSCLPRGIRLAIGRQFGRRRASCLLLGQGLRFRFGIGGSSAARGCDPVALVDLAHFVRPLHRSGNGAIFIEATRAAAEKERERRLGGG